MHYWRKMLRSRSWAGRHFTGAAFNRLIERVPLLRPQLRLPYRALADSRSARNQRPKRVVGEIRTLRSGGWLPMGRETERHAVLNFTTRYRT